MKGEVKRERKEGIRKMMLKGRESERKEVVKMEERKEDWWWKKKMKEEKSWEYNR